MKIETKMSVNARLNAIEKIRWSAERIACGYISLSQMAAYSSMIVDQMLKLKPGCVGNYRSYVISLSTDSDAVKPYVLELIESGIFIPFADAELKFIQKFFTEE